MNIFYAFLLGIVQGLTEFIPVSSTAHLLLAQRLLGIDPNDQGLFAFNVLVQWGTLMAVIAFYWKDLWAIGRAWVMGIIHRQPFADPQARLGWYLILGTIPALAAGALLKKLVEWLFTTQALEAIIRLWLTAILLVLAERIGRRNRGMESLTWKDALWVGCAQILAVFPGSSRSGSTIFGGMLRNLDRPSAARFAFLLSVPVMVAAGGYELLDLRHVANLTSFLPSLAVGVIVSAVVGFFAIRWLIGYLSRRSLYAFAVYCAVLGVAAIFLLKF